MLSYRNTIHKIFPNDLPTGPAKGEYRARRSADNYRYEGGVLQSQTSFAYLWPYKYHFAMRYQCADY